ncbi:MULTISPECIES: hypothetical protein [Kitasatospora]|nr:MULTISPECIES: hypothetical protein [Kitasatospora]
MPARNRLLPRNRSWPLTATDVRTALGDPMMDGVILSFHEHPSESRVLLSATWNRTVRSNYAYGETPDWWGKVLVGVGNLPSAERAAARELLREQALPALREWTAEALRRADEPWALRTRQRHWSVLDGRVVHCDEPA